MPPVATLGSRGTLPDAGGVAVVGGAEAVGGAVVVVAVVVVGGAVGVGVRVKNGRDLLWPYICRWQSTGYSGMFRYHCY